MMNPKKDNHDNHDDGGGGGDNHEKRLDDKRSLGKDKLVIGQSHTKRPRRCAQPSTTNGQESKQKRYTQKSWTHQNRGERA